MSHHIDIAEFFEMTEKSFNENITLGNGDLKIIFKNWAEMKTSVRGIDINFWRKTHSSHFVDIALKKQTSAIEETENYTPGRGKKWRLNVSNCLSVYPCKWAEESIVKIDFKKHVCT